MKFAVTFGTVSHRYWLDVAAAADDTGFESVWLPEHLVLPIEMAGSPYTGVDHPPVPPETPIHCPTTFLSFVAARTERIRLGTYVYLLGLRHPFSAARSWATLDILSGGRAVLGAGAGWLATEWTATGLDPATRGSRLDEAIDVCRRLWTEPVIEHHGTHFDFGPVAFEPKPVQQPIPIHIGGEGPRALGRVARTGDGWLGMGHSIESAGALIRSLHDELDRVGRPRSAVEVTVSGPCESPADVDAWTDLGVDRLIVRPWSRSSEATAAMADFARRFAGAFADS
jgi:probable F420-dependent oxidoreductase